MTHPSGYNDLSKWRMRLLDNLGNEGAALEDLFFLTDDEEIKRFLLNYLAFFHSDRLGSIQAGSLERPLLTDYYWLTGELDALSSIEKFQVKEYGMYIKACWEIGKTLPDIDAYVARTWPQLSMSVSLCATVLSYAIKYGCRLDRITRFSMDDEFATPSAGRVRIAAVAMVKERREVARAFIEYLKKLGDVVVVSDGNLGSPGYDLDKEFSDVIFLDQGRPFHETRIKGRLWDVCRRHGATHILMLDSDERLCPDITVEELRRYAARCPPGTVLSVPWVQSFGTDSIINYDAIGKSSYARNLPPYKDLFCADDGRSQHINLTLHTPISNRPGKRCICDDLAIIHLEGSLVSNLVGKTNQYWRRDYGTNGNLAMCYQRYLPRTVRLLLLQKRLGEAVSASGVPREYADTIRLLSDAGPGEREEDVVADVYHPKIAPFAWAYAG